MLKKIVAAAGIVSALVLAMLTVNYAVNEYEIKRCADGRYGHSSVNALLGFTQPYIYPYNMGNEYYMKGDYEGAEQRYREALEKTPGGDRDCKIRINLALSVVKQIDPDTVTSDELDSVIERLEDAKTVLTENGCAHMDDAEGHSEDAQTLKDEIDRFEETLRQQSQPQEQPDDKNQSDGNDTDEDQDDETSKKSDEIKQKLKEIQGDSIEQRNQEMDEYESYKDGYTFYNGATW